MVDSDWSQFHRHAAVEFWFDDKKRTAVLIDDVFPEDESCRIWFKMRLTFIDTADLIRGLGMSPSHVNDKTFFKVHLSWSGNFARLRGEVWELKHDGERVYLSMPEWAVATSLLCGIQTAAMGRGHNQRLREVAQEVVDAAIKEGMFPHPLKT